MSGDGRITLVTGAGSGIGKAAALALANAGFRLALAGRRLDALEETAAATGLADADILCVSTDVSDPASVDALFAAIVEKYGRLDVLFNNAGTNTPGRDDR